MRRVVLAFSLAAAVAVAGSARAAEEQTELKHPNWSFDGILGTYDRAALQRGFQVYKEVCSACHPVKHLSFRNLGALGFNQDEVKAIAAQYQVTDGPNDQGEMFQRAAKPSDPIPGPFKNEQAARAANNGAYPPDLSLIVKAREGGPDYVFSILTGFEKPPQGFKVNAGMHYNTAFPGHQIAMPPPLTEGAVTYADGTKATVPQMAHDVTTFLTWAAEPRMEERKRTGLKVMIFLFVGTGVFYGVKRKIWSKVH